MAIRTFDLQDEIFAVFANDDSLLALLGNPSTADELNNKIRREINGMDEVEGNLDFIVMYFLPTGGSGRNHLVKQGHLFVDYYCSLRYNAQQMSGICRELIRSYSNDEIILSEEGQVPSGITGVYLYRQRYTPLVKN